MKTKALISAAVIAFLACPVEAIGQTEKIVMDFAKAYSGGLCTDVAKCVINVKVGPECAFTVTPYTEGVVRDHGNVKIHWVIDATSSAEFTKDGIAFKPGSNWGQEFDSPTLIGPKEFRWNDKNPRGAQRGRPFGYGIKVMQGGKLCTYDPTIVNDY